MSFGKEGREVGGVRSIGMRRRSDGRGRVSLVNCFYLAGEVRFDENRLDNMEGLVACGTEGGFPW